MYLFRGGSASNSPEALQVEMGKWEVWMGELGASGKLIGGEPLLDTGKLVASQGSVVTDGPFTEGKEIVGGYVAVNAADYDEAVALTKGCPQLGFEGGTVEVREIMKM
jgi:hypothetical protein